MATERRPVDSDGAHEQLTTLVGATHVASDLSAGEDDITALLEHRERTGDSAGDARPAVTSPLDESHDDVVIPRREHHVTAVLVSHDGARWLPATLTAMSRLRRRPDRVVGVDTGSLDATQDILARGQSAGLVDRVANAPRDAAFGSAVAAALATSSGVADEGVDVVRWVWLLHDDSAPAAGALDALLLTADTERSAAVIGPKLRGWRTQSQLLEAGVTVARSGTRVTGLEHRELDQGQHDGVRDTLAVSSAGMLVRRDAWDALGGFDPALALFRDDIDFCWRAHRAGYRVVVTTDAVVHHREAATHSRRPVDAGAPAHPERARRLDRSAAIHLMRSHASGPGRIVVTLRLLLGSVLRALALLLGKAPDEAFDEWGAFSDALRDRSALHASRTRVAAAGALPGAIPDADVRHLLSPRRTQARHAWEYLVDTVAGRETGDASRSVLDSTPDDPDGWYADDRRPSRLRRFLTRPGTLLMLGLVLSTLVAVRALLGEGVLVGGALQPAPEGAGDLWTLYLQSWHEVGPGSPADAPAWLVPLTFVATLLRGSASTAVDLLLLGAVPLAGLTAWWALRGLTATTWSRVWAATTYALLPAVTGAIAGGRIGSAAAIVLLPWLARSCARLVGVGGPPTWRRAFGTSLLMAVIASFTPVVWLVAAVLALIGSVTVARDLVSRVRLLLVVVLPVALLMPWSLRVLREPALLWLEPGLVGPTDPRIAPVDLLFLRPGGPGSSPLWLGVGVVVAGILALGVPGVRRPALAAWVCGFVALTIGVVETQLRVTPTALVDPVAPWPGVPTAIWAGGLIVAVVLAADRVPVVLAGANFGWRQPTAAVMSVLLALAPLGALALFLLGVDGPLARGSREVVPAFVGAEMRGDQRPRTIVLRRLNDGRLAYDLLSVPDTQTGDLDVAPPASVSAQIDRLVARLAAGIGADEVDALATHGVRYLMLADAARRGDPLVETLDGERGLRRLSSRRGDTLWQLAPVSSRAQALTAVTVGSVVSRSSIVVPTVGGDPRTTTRVDTRVASGAPGRQLVLAEAADDRWSWTLDAVPGMGTAPETSEGPDPSLQVVPLHAGATDVTITFLDPARPRWLWAQAGLALVVLLLALPSRRRVLDDEEPDADLLDPTSVQVAPNGTAVAPDPGVDPGVGEIGLESEVHAAAGIDRLTVTAAEARTEVPTVDSSTTKVSRTAEPDGPAVRPPRAPRRARSPRAASASVAPEDHASPDTNDPTPEAVR